MFIFLLIFDSRINTAIFSREFLAMVQFNFLFVNEMNKVGEEEIRTLGTIDSYTGLAIRRFRPLSHLSYSYLTNVNITLNLVKIEEK